jgi:hypothetical protein
LVIDQQTEQLDNSCLSRIEDNIGELRTDQNEKIRKQNFELKKEKFLEFAGKILETSSEIVSQKVNLLFQQFEFPASYLTICKSQ